MNQLVVPMIINVRLPMPLALAVLTALALTRAMTVTATATQLGTPAAKPPPQPALQTNKKPTSRQVQPVEKYNKSTPVLYFKL